MATRKKKPAESTYYLDRFGSRHEISEADVKPEEPLQALPPAD